MFYQKEHYISAKEPYILAKEHSIQEVKHSDVGGPVKFGSQTASEGIVSVYR